MFRDWLFVFYCLFKVVHLHCTADLFAFKEGMFILKLIFNLNVCSQESIATWFKSSMLKKFSWSKLIFQLVFPFTLSKWGNKARLEPHGLLDFLGRSLLALGWTETLYLHSAGIWFHHKWPSTDSEKGKERCQCSLLVFCCPQTGSLQ